MLPALIPILLQSLIPALPPLAALFGKSGEKVDQKVAAATQVLSVVKQAVGAVNEQEAVARVTSDPVARASAQAAVMADPVISALIAEVGGGIEAARKAAADPGAVPFWRQGAFAVSLILLAMPLMLLADVFYVHADNYTGELRTQIVTAVLVVISMVGGYWLGTTANSSRKTELLAAGR